MTNQQSQSVGTEVRRPGSMVRPTSRIMAILCVMAGVLACTAAPPPEPPPTPTVSGPRVAAMEDMPGWWMSDASEYVIWNVDMDGTFRLHYREPGCIRCLVPATVGFLEAGEDEWRLNDYYGWNACLPTEIGVYGVTVPVPDTLQFDLVDEACGEGIYGIARSFFYESRLYRRVSDYDPLMGHWRPTTDSGTHLLFREDLRYGHDSEASPSANSDLTGTFYVSEGQLRIQDHFSTCARLKVGAYETDIEGDSLSLKVVEDACEERRAALTATSYTRDDPADQLEGWWVPAGDRRYQLRLTRGGLFALSDNQSLEGGPIRSGTFDRTEGEVAVVDVFGQAPCDAQPGTYQYRVEEDKLTLEPTNDGCSARRDFFAANGDWQRVQP